MPYKQSLYDLFTRHAEGIGIVLLTAIAVIGRAFYTGARWREVVGDLILCPLITFVVTPLFPDKIMGLTVTPELLALLVGVAGVHGVRYAASAVARRKGIDINKLKDRVNNG